MEERYSELTQEQREKYDALRPSAKLFLGSLSNEQIICLIAFIPNPQFPESYFQWQALLGCLDMWRNTTYQKIKNNPKYDRDFEKCLEEFFVVEIN